MTKGQWKTEQLGNVANLVMGQSPASKFYNEDEQGLPFLQGCAQFGKMSPETAIFCSQPKKIAPLDAILFSVRAPVGEINLADREYCIGRGVAAISGRSCDTEYLRHYLLSLIGDYERVSQGSTFTAINSAALSDISIHYPTDSQYQAKIAEILTAVDRAIDYADALIAKYKRVKAGLMQDLMTRGIDEAGNIRDPATHTFKDSEVGRIPTEWDMVGTEQFLMADGGIKPGPFGSSLKKNIYSKSGYRVYGQEQVIAGSLAVGNYFINAATYKALENFSIRSNDLLISLVGTTGKVLIVPETFESGIINPRLIRLRPNPLKTDTNYLSYLLSSQLVRNQFDNIVQGGTMAVLSGRSFRQLVLPQPKKEEQATISKMLRKHDDTLDAATLNRAKLGVVKRGLMQDLLTGRVSVEPLLSAATPSL